MIAACVAVILSIVDDGGLSPEQFTRIVSSEMAVLHDVVFVYEGGRRFVGPEDLATKYADRIGGNFQGTLATRVDGALFVDSYYRQLEPLESPLGRQAGFVLGRNTEYLTFTPDRKVGSDRKFDKPAARIFLAIPGTPLHLLYTWFFQTLDASEISGYKSHGYEEIDGTRCLHVELDTFANIKTRRPQKTHYWIAIQRGGHPVRVESFQDGRLAARVSIRVENVESAGGSLVWLPTFCTNEMFGIDGSLYDKPMIRETIKAVTASIRVNAGLDDEVFSMKSKGVVTDTSALQQLREEYQKQPEKHSFRSDVKSVQARIDHNLALAEEQGRLLKASAPGENADWGPWLQLALAGAGATLVATALWLKLRRR
jgi:hypothetical protein